MAAELTIGDFSRITHLSVKTLRHYHRVGLLEPADVNPGTGYRYYTVAQVPVAQTIRRFRDLDMPVEQVRAVLAAPDEATRDALVSAHLDRLQHQLAETQSAIASLRALLTAPSPAIDIERRMVPAVTALAISTTVGRADLIEWWTGAMQELHDTLAAQGMVATGAPGGIFGDGLFTDDHGDALVFIPVDEIPIDEELIPSGSALRRGDGVVTLVDEAFSPVEASDALKASDALEALARLGAGPPGRARLYTVPAAELAITLVNGSHDDIDRVYAALGTYAAELGVDAHGPAREYYLVGGPDVAAWRTEIGWPIGE